MRDVKGGLNAEFSQTNFRSQDAGNGNHEVVSVPSKVSHLGSAQAVIALLNPAQRYALRTAGVPGTIRRNCIPFAAERAYQWVEPPE